MRGMTEVTVQCNDQTAKLPMYVTHKNCPAILGRVAPENQTPRNKEAVAWFHSAAGHTGKAQRGFL